MGCATRDFASDMHSHGNGQAKAQVDADVVTEGPLSRHHLGHRSQTENLA